MAAPRGRSRNVTGSGRGVSRRGSGLGTGPVGSGSFGGGRGSGHSSSGHSSNGSNFRPSGYGTPHRNPGGGVRMGGSPKLFFIIIIVVLLLGGKGFLSSILGGSGSSGSGSSSSAGLGSIVSLLGSGSSSYTNNVSSVSSVWGPDKNVGVLDRSVSPEARDKYTTIIGNGKDVVTIMVYLCGTDLESKNGMGTADLQEMAAATLSDNVNLIVYTGGCKKWKNNLVSSSRNQIYQVKSGGVKLLEDDMGSVSMSDPATLTTFIIYNSKTWYL